MIKRTSIIALLSIALLSTLIASPPSWTPITGTQYSMILNADILLDGETFSGEGENVAAAFGPGGENDCRSIGIWYPDYDGFWYFTIRGNINYETISFRIYNETDDEIYLSEDTVDFINNTTIGSGSTPHPISFTSPVSALPAPENVTISINPELNFLKISWDHVPEADFYNVYWSDTPDINSGTYLGQTISTNWTQSGIPISNKFFWVTSVTNPIPASQDSNFVPNSSE